MIEAGGALLVEGWPGHDAKILPKREVDHVMGTWDVEPFGNDDAADFAFELDDAPASVRIEMIGAVLERVANDDGHRLSDPPRAVAAAALVAAQYPDGVPTSTSGPTTPMPEFPGHLRSSAVQALDRVTTAPTGLAEAWDASPDGPAWRRTIADLRTVLDPPQRAVLFDL
jgi:hypothetical protein